MQGEVADEEKKARFENRYGGVMDTSTAQLPGSASAKWGNVLYPNVGELWKFKDRVVVIARNTLEQNGLLWVMDWATGERCNATLVELHVDSGRFSLGYAAFIDRMRRWARGGNSHAMGYLGWWYEVSNQQRSVWYYIAALRASPETHKWAHDRIVDNANNPSALLCNDNGLITGHPAPELSFLYRIPELHSRKVHSHLWSDAIREAEEAPDMSPFDECGR